MIDEGIADEVAEALGDLKSDHLNNQVRIHREGIETCEHQNAEWTQMITQNLHRMRETRDTLDIAKEAAESETFAKHLQEEWKHLREHPRLERASFEEGGLVLTTTPDLRLKCEGREDTRWLGAFRITIDLASFQIRLTNLHTRRGGRDHPHVVNNQPCFGGDHGAFVQLHSQGDLNTLFELILQYLETLNLRDEYGRFGAYWFEAEDLSPEREDETRRELV